jgi:hypothetical protein
MSNTKDKFTTKKQFLLRVDSKLWNDIERWAASEMRSVNGQIEYILKQAVQQKKKKTNSEAES